MKILRKYNSGASSDLGHKGGGEGELEKILTYMYKRLYIIINTCVYEDTSVEVGPFTFCLDRLLSLNSLNYKFYF